MRYSHFSPKFLNFNSIGQKAYKLVHKSPEYKYKNLKDENFYRTLDPPYGWVQCTIAQQDFASE